MNNIKFEDFSAKVLEEIDERSIAFLYEVKDSIAAQASRNCKVGKVNGGNLKQSFLSDSFVDEKEMTAYIGSSLKYAIWQEFGTGEYALKNNGHKGGWYVPIGNGEKMMSEDVAEAYGFRISKNKNGQKFAFVKGSKPKRMLYNAFLRKQGSIGRAAQKVFK